jgi:hypothetical protein
MLIAQQKEKENIAEYIIYMYQIEDVVRACDLNLERVMSTYVIPQLPDASFEGQYRTWYMAIVDEMKRGGMQKTGHLSRINEIMVELSYLHNTLLNLANDPKYKTVFEAASPFIEEFKQRSDLKDKNHIEIAFHAMYMKLLLRLQKKDITQESEEAFDAMRMMLAYLSRAYHKMKSGDLDFLNN